MFRLLRRSGASRRGGPSAIRLTPRRPDGYGREWLVERNERIRAVTVADAKRAAEALFGDGALSVVMVGRPAG